MILSRRAAADLYAIWRYSEDRWGTAQADAYVADLHRASARLIEDPSLGRPVDDRLPGVWRLRQASHVLIYRTDGAMLTILAILHGRMDILRNLP